MTSQIVFKEKDYEFLYKARIIPMVQTADNPLRLDRPRVQVQRGKRQNIRIKAQGNFVDPLLRGDSKPKQDPLLRQTNPLSRAQNTNPLAKQQIFDPLARPQTVDPLGRQQQQQQQTLQQKQIQQPSKSVEPQKQQEIIQEQEEIKKNQDFSLLWQDIRGDFVRIFKIKDYNLEQPVTNPFGNQVQTMNVYDGQAKTAYSGSNKIEYDKSNQRQQGQKQILQKIYIQKLEDIRKDLKKNWVNGDKVASLQLAIQSCKLLIDTDKPQFVPIKYIYIIDVLELFGKMVIERLLKLSYPSYTDQKISEISLQNVIGSNFSENASEIGRNWLIKIGSIRELIPRLYVEATLLKVHYFIDQSQIRPIFYRLIKQVRAIGDYINAMYFALYLFRIGAELFSGDKEYLITTLKDFFIYMNQKGKFGKPELSQDQYLQLFEPYLIQTFRQYSQNCSEREFKEIFENFRQSNQNHVVLKTMIDEFQAIHICSMALELFSIMQAYPVQTKYSLYASFLPKIAKGLTNKAAGVEICQLVLNDIMHIKSFTLFLDILASLIELIFRSFEGYQKNQFFFQILSRFNDLFTQVEQEEINSDQSKETFVKLEQFIIKIFSEAEDLGEVLQIDTFISCIQFFPGEMKSNICLTLLQLIINRSNDRITDPIQVSSIIKLAIILNKKQHKKNDAQLNIDKQLSQILSKLLYIIDFNKDLEQTLNLYAEIRSHFSHLPDVSEILINRTIELIFRAKKFQKGKNKKLVTNFIQACIAYCFITIPTIENLYSKVKAYIQVAEIGLSLNLISQTESIFKTTVETLIELPDQIQSRPTDEVMLPLILHLLSFLIILPDDPSAGYMTLFQGVMKCFEQFKWNQKNGEINRMLVYINCIQYLCCSVQERLPYHLEQVKSNDQLFNKDPQYSLKILELVQELYQKICDHAQELHNKQISDHQENTYILRILLHTINRLIVIVKFQKGTGQPFEPLLNLMMKKLNDMSRERSGRAQILQMKQNILITILTLEKQTSVNTEQIKPQILKILEQK